MKPLSHSVVSRLVAFLCGLFGAVIGSKASLPWALAALAFDAARALGVKVPSGEQLVRDYGTTIGPSIWPPERELDPVSLLVLMVHELTHVKQWWRDPARMMVWYVQHREMRAGRYEGEAYGQGYAMLWALTGQLPARVEDLPSALVYGYALEADDVALAQSELEQLATSIHHGVIPLGPARKAIAWLYREDPAFLHPDSLAKIQANCPEVLTEALS